METYFHGSSEIQAAAAVPADGIQTLLLMNPNYLSSYSDSTTQHHQPQPPNMLFFNPTTTATAAPGSNSLNISNLAHAPPPNAYHNHHHHHHHLVGIPLPGTSATNEEIHSRSSSLHGVLPAGFQYNLWGPIDQNPVVSVAAVSHSGEPHDVISSQIEIRRPVMVSPARQGLSLSLSSQQVTPPAPFRLLSNEHEIQAVTISSTDDRRAAAGNSPPSVSAVSNGGVSGMQSVILSSKYLRAAQELLDEVVNVGKAIKSDLLTERAKEKMKMNKESLIGEGSSGDGPGGETNAKRGAELNIAQRQELQLKKAKLVNILDEVEQRYRQYHHQMQIVVSSFEQASGFGAAKSYTALALQTISKQFRCLKDAISEQIRAASKSLGEEDCLGAKVEGSSRLRYVDRQLRQQRALQQLGMIQHHAWRPQRGLPERAVSVLRAWLFEHFLHPYPKDSDKHMLAKQTGLTRSQVSNWFINARVRLWKPMVEEMYTEEMKNQEKNGSDKENASKNENKESGSNSVGPTQMDQLKAIPSKQENPTKHNASPTEFSNSTISISPIGGSIQTQSSGFSLIRPSELEGIAQRNLKKQRSASDMQNSSSSILSMDMDLKHGETNREISVNLGRLTKEGYSLITSNATAHGCGGGFGAYTIGELSRFNPEQLTPRFSSGNGTVSLTLGLPHCENLSLSGTQQNYLPNQNIQLGRRVPDIAGADEEPEFCGINVSQNSQTGTGFETMDSQNRNRFAAQLLPDFVA